MTDTARSAERVTFILGIWSAFVLLVGTASADIMVTSVSRIEGKITRADPDFVVMDLSLGGTKTLPTRYVLELLVDSPERESCYRTALANTDVKVGSSWGQYPPPETSNTGRVRSEMISEAGRHLESARALAFWCVGTAVASSVTSILLSSNTHVSAAVRIGIPVGLDLVSFICGLVAWGEVGQAGTMMVWSKEPSGDRQ